jgi:hypothetical protein
LKYGVGLNHLPSGRFGANAAWATLNVIAHNLGCWVNQIGLGRAAVPVTTKTIRTRMLSMPGRKTSSGGRSTLHLPQGSPWEESFTTMLVNLRSVLRPSICPRA